MKRMAWLVVGVLLGCGAVVQGGTTNRYVSLTGTNNSPYTNWADAATNIQSAVAVAGSGDIIWITNGTYTLTNQVSITNAITLAGFNGNTATFINGNYPQTTNRCFMISNASAIISGLTISNGYAAGLNAGGTNGGGLLCLMGGLIQSCVISSNMAAWQGGGVYMLNGAVLTNSTVAKNWCGYEGAGIYCKTGTIQNCIISNNYSGTDAGGILLDNNTDGPATIKDCMICGNVATNGAGGGILAFSGGLIENCTIRNNISSGNGGGVYVCANTVSYVKNCTIAGNQAWAGGGIIFLNHIMVDNCLIANNVALKDNDYGGGAGAYMWDQAGLTPRPTIRNCTIVSNSAPYMITAHSGSGIWQHGSAEAGFNYAINTIIYSNTAGGGVDNCSGHGRMWYTNSCSPNFGTDSGNTPANPQFVDWTGNYRLNANSPCVNTGTNQDGMTSAVDLDGHHRIDRLRGRVDMGAYEFIHKITLITGH